MATIAIMFGKLKRTNVGRMGAVSIAFAGRAGSDGRPGRDASVFVDMSDPLNGGDLR
jgi:hypothetical protein